MKRIIYVLGTLLLLAACKKDAGKHCPVINESGNTGHLVDLSPVAWIPMIMDSLAKYPKELQAYRVNFNTGFDPGSFSAQVVCHIYYKDLVVFNSDYVLSMSSWESNYMRRNYIPSGLSLSTTPDVSQEEAAEIAEKTIHYKGCQAASLGILNKGDTTLDYRLVWRIRGVEGGYPRVDLDAHSGQIYSTDDGLRY